MEILSLQMPLECLIQSHRMGQVGRHHSGHLFQPPQSSRVILEHRAQDCAQTILEYLQSGRLHDFSGQSVPVFGCLHIKEVLPLVQVELPEHQCLPTDSH